MILLTYFLSLIVGILAFGNAVLIPLVHLAIVGELNYLLLFVFSTFASVISDSIWYLIGRTLPKERVLRLPFLKKRIDSVEKFSGFFGKYSLRILFYSRFVWGTRIATRLLSGIHKINFFKYITVNVASTLVWFFAASAISFAVHTGVTPLEDTDREIELGLAIFIILVLILYAVIKAVVNKKKP